MKRYLLFCYESYYPRGGWHDFVNSFDTIPEAMVGAVDHRREYFHIIDSVTGNALDVSSPHNDAP